MATPRLKTDVASLEARAAVHEMIIFQMMMALYVQPEGGPDRLQYLMTEITRAFSVLLRNAPAGERQQTELALQYVEGFSERILQHAAHVTKH